MDETTEWLRVPAAEPRGVLADGAGPRTNNRLRLFNLAGSLEATVGRLAVLQGIACPRADLVDVVLFADLECGEFPIVPELVVDKRFGATYRNRAAISKSAVAIDAQLVEINFGATEDHRSNGAVLNIRPGPTIARLGEESHLNRHQLACAMHAGRHAAERSKLAGTQLFIGEVIGTGVVSRAAALACSLLAVSPERLFAPVNVDLGLGCEERRSRLPALHPQLESPIEALRRVGGFGISALTGSYMACAHMGLPVLVDGFVSSVAALAAACLIQGAEDWLLFSHNRREPRSQVVFEAIEARPFTYAGKHPQDGAGAAAVPLLRHACSLVTEDFGAEATSQPLCNAPSAFR